MSLYHRLPAIARYWRNQLQRAVSTDTPIRFRCNICGRHNSEHRSLLSRHNASCRCGSSVRVRSIIDALTRELFGRSLAIPDIPSNSRLSGIDMSGLAVYADRLADKIGYTNTFLHKEPQLDILSPPPHWDSCFDYVISSDVFEHVTPPVYRAFENTLRMLKPGGLFVLTVPYSREDDTLEHYPDLHTFHIEVRNGQRVLVNRTKIGRTQVFNNPVFHGGDGSTLEMRVFSQSGVLDSLSQSGFVDIRIHDEEAPDFGILWPEPWSLPITARRPERGRL